MKCCDRKPIRYIPSFIGFTAYQPEVPAMYWNVKSQEQRILAIVETLHKLVCYVDCLGEKGNELRADLDELVEEFNRLKEGGLLDYYEEQLNAWIIEHMPEIISKYVKQVFFGLTLDGHFVAYIPEGSAWEDVVFDTGQDYTQDNYGRLMLYYVTDSTSDVWQENEVNQYQSQIDQLSRTVEENKEIADNRYEVVRIRLDDEHGFISDVNDKANANMANIATNTADIATNTADIATNTADIATNTADIARVADQSNTNSQDIAAIEETLYTPVEPDENEGGN